MALKFKLTENGNIVMNDKGLVIVIDDEKNEEFAFDALSNYTRLSQVNAESKERKLKIREMEETFKPFLDLEGDETFGDFFNKAQEAITQVENFNEKDWTKTKDVEKIKQQAQENIERKLEAEKKKYEEQLRETQEKIARRDKIIFDLKVNDRFSTSVFVKEKLAMTPKVARAYFGNRFKVEKNDNGILVVMAYDEDGERIPSRETVGEYASFDEALEILVDKDPDKKSLLKGSGASGGGATGDGGGSGGDDEKNPWSDEHLNLTRQGEILDKDPALAKRLANQAGKVLPEAI